MVEAVHEVAHEATHEAAHSGTSFGKKIGLLISVLALVLAVSEMLGKSAQTRALALNIEASNTWNFFQAKTMRQTALRTAAESMKVQNPQPSPEIAKQLQTWQATIERWESEPSTNEGRKELMVKARATEKLRDVNFEQYHGYEIASLVVQLGIVLASVALLSSVMMFAFGAGALGGLGLLVLLDTYFGWHIVSHFLH